MANGSLKVRDNTGVDLSLKNLKKDDCIKEIKISKQN